MPCPITIKENLEKQVDKMSAKGEGKSLTQAKIIADWVNGIFKTKVVKFVKNGDFIEKLITIPNSLVSIYYNEELKLEKEEENKAELEKIGEKEKLTDEQLSEQIRLEQENKNIFSPFALFNTLLTKEKPIKLNDSEYKELYTNSNESKLTNDGRSKELLLSITYGQGTESFNRFEQNILQSEKENGVSIPTSISNISNKIFPTFGDLWTRYTKGESINPIQFSESIVNRILAGGGFIGGLQEALVKKGLETNISITNIEGNPPLMVENKKLVINITEDFVKYLKEFSQKGDIGELFEFALAEEYLHIIQQNTISFEEINKIWDELSVKDRENLQKSYHLVDDLKDVQTFPKETYVLELLRMKTQEILYGKSSENVKLDALNESPTLLQFLKDLFKDIINLFKNKPKDSVTNLILQRQLDFIEGKETPLTDENFNIISPFGEVQSEVDKISKEIADSIDSSEIVKNVDEYFDVISKHLRNLRERKSYERLKKIFTTEEGINKLSTLQDILNEATKAQDDIEGDRRKVRALAQTIVQIDHLSDLAIEDIKDIVKNTDGSVENLKILQSYLNTFNDWDILLETANKSFAIGNPTTTKKIGEVKLKIKQIENLISKNDESGVVKSLQEILVPASKDMIKVLNKEIAQLNEKLQRQINRKADDKIINETKTNIKSLEDKVKAIDFENSQNIIDFLKGKKGDATIFNSWLESFRDSSDPTIAAFTTFVKQNIDEVANKSYKEDLQYQKDLAPHITDRERKDPASLSEKITFLDKVLKDGLLTTVITLLNEWKDYRYDYQTLQNKEQEAKTKYSESKLEEDKLAYLEAKKNRQKFESDYLYTEYLPEVYEKYKLFDDEIGQELKQESDRIFNRIAELNESYRLFGTEPTEQEELEKEDLLLQYTMLGNLNQPNGTAKTGKELDKAKKMQEIRTLNRKFFEWKDNANMFEKAKERHSEYIISTGIAEDSQEYRDAMQKWEQKNTRLVIKDSFYKKREAITKEINYLTKKFKDEKLQENIKELWDVIQSITYGLRDEDGQPIGILVQEKGAERIKIAQESIQDLQDKVTQISGLTKEEQSLLNELFDKSKSGVITQEEREDLSNLLNKSKTEGLSKIDKERLFQLFSDLRNLQSNVPTEYYIQAVNNLSTKYGVTLLDNGEVLDGDKVVPFLESPKLDKLLLNKDFKEWFELNHIQVKKFNTQTKQIEQKWQRTYQWNKIVPNDEQYVEVKPSLKYSYRQIKPEYKTEKIVGKTVDNRGNWLPNPDKAASFKYKNEKYFKLVNGKDAESKKLSTILDIHKQHLLDAQEDLARNAKLYLDVPRVEREGAERNISFIKEAMESPGSIPKLIWERIKEKYRDATNFDVSDERYESPFEGKYDKDFIKIPIKYTGNVDANKVSLDLFRSISKYNYSTNLNRKLVETLPIARALTRVLEKSEEHKTAKNKNSNRINAIRKIVIANYEGQKSNLDLQKLGAAEKPVTAVIHLAKYLASWATIKINIPAAIANVVNAEFQNVVNLANELYTPKSYVLAKSLLATRFTPAFMSDYAKNKLGETSLESQLVDYFEPIQGESLQEMIGEKSKQSKLFDFLSLNPLFNLRNWGEFEVQSSNWLAAMIETKVNLGQDVISLVDAYELDDKGFIKLKNGVDFSWDIGGANFNRLKAKVQTLNRRIHGNYASYDKTQLEMYALGSLAMFLKRFFVSMAANRFAYGDNIHEGRFNINTSEFQHGYYINTFSILQKQLKNGLRDWDLLSTQDKQSLIKTTTEIGIIFGSLALLALMGYSGDDRNKKKKLKDYSWLELNTLYQIDRLFVETKSFISPKSYFDYTVDFQIKTALEKWYKLLTDFISQEEYQSSLKSSDGSYVYKKGDKKYKTQLKRATGIQQMLNFKEDPDVMLQNYDKTVRGR